MILKWKSFMIRYIKITNILYFKNNIIPNNNLQIQDSNYGLNLHLLFYIKILQLRNFLYNVNNIKYMIKIIHNMTLFLLHLSPNSNHHNYLFFKTNIIIAKLPIIKHMVYLT